jgi:hypothetical protein
LHSQSQDRTLRFTSRINSILYELIVRPVLEVPKKQWLHKGTSTIDDEELVLSISKIVPCNKYCK